MHKGVSPFEELGIDMIDLFPLDYLHLVLLGVFKRLLAIWTGTWNKKWRKDKLSLRQLAEIDRRLKLIRLSYPKEFHRIPVTFKNVKSWKAVELRSLLLYTGPVIFKGILPPKLYKHFLYLHLGIRILASETQVYRFKIIIRNIIIMVTDHPILLIFKL